MLDFKTPEISDKEWVNECMRSVRSMNCEYTFGNVFIWAASYYTQICRYKDFFMCRWGKNGKYTYCLPIGKGDFKEAVEQLIKDAENNGIQLRLYGVTDCTRAMLDEDFPQKFSYVYDDAFNDYIYSVEKMANLSGKKYHGKRNHISNFKKNNPDWSFEPIGTDNISECIDLHMNWIKEHDNSAENDSDYSLEFEAVLTAFENFESLDMTGGIIRVNGKAIAYTLGEKLSDRTFVTHFEKAPADLQGAYTIINQEFTKNCLMQYEYVNREEDLGIEGLRKAKLSYRPEIILKKCIAVYEG